MRRDEAGGDWQLLVLAGGQGNRLGGIDKGLMTIAGQPAVRHLQARFRPPAMRVSANRHHAEYARLGLPAVADWRPGFCGPLAGLEALLAEAGRQRVVVLPCDMPFLPLDLPARLLALLDSRDSLVAAHDGERLQPLCLAFFADAWRDDLSRYLDSGRRSVQGWLDDKPLRLCRFADAAAFRNLNTPADVRLSSPGEKPRSA